MKKSLIGLSLWKLLSLFALLFFLSASQSHALDVTLAWDANREPDLIGYRVYQSNTSGVYTFGPGHAVRDLTKAQTGDPPSCTLTNVPDGTWYWVVTAYDDEGYESSVGREIIVLGPNHPDLGSYDRGWGITYGDLKGFTVCYNDPDSPTLGSSYDIPPIPGVNPVGVRMNLQPSGVTFNPHVKIFIPCPGYADVSSLNIYYYDDTRMSWFLANDAADPDIVQPDALDWLVEDSRVNHSSGDPSTIEIQVYHFSGAQAGTPSSPSSTLSGKEGAGGCFVDTLLPAHCH